MASFIIASVPVHGHVTPLLPLAGELIARGHQVRFLTGARFADAVRRTGAEHVPLPAEADFDDRTVTEHLPERARLSATKAIAFDIEHVFVRPAAAQYRALRRMLADETAEAVICDPTFAAGPLLGELPADRRPVLVAAGVLPLNHPGPGLAPFGLGLPPLGGAAGAVRNAVLHAATRRLFEPVEAAFAQIAQDVHGHAPSTRVMEWMHRADLLCQLSVPSFEYPRPDAPATLVFTGPVSTSAPGEHPLPEWWEDLDGSRPVVHVTQGTLANDDLGELVLPTLAALADEDVLVVVATGGAPLSSLGALPANARAAEFLPYDQLMPRLSAYVTNGGYGGAHFALRHGVPIVVAPGQEDKIEVAARIAWSGAGLNLGSRRATPARLRRATGTVLREPRFREAARRIGADIAASPGVAGFADAVETVAGRAVLEPAA
jgi:UDP:flavonoid glycosyltransferase YjiC (YdhE family)